MLVSRNSRLDFRVSKRDSFESSVLISSHKAPLSVVWRDKKGCEGSFKVLRSIIKFRGCSR